MNSKTGYNVQYAFFIKANPKKKKKGTEAHRKTSYERHLMEKSTSTPSADALPFSGLTQGHE